MTERSWIRVPAGTALAGFSSALAFFTVAMVINAVTSDSTDLRQITLASRIAMGLPLVMFPLSTALFTRLLRVVESRGRMGLGARIAGMIFAFFVFATCAARSSSSFASAFRSEAGFSSANFPARCSAFSHAESLYSFRTADTRPVGCTRAGTFLPLIDRFHATATGSPSFGISGDSAPERAISLRDGFQVPRFQTSMLKMTSSPDSCTSVPKPFS